MKEPYETRLRWSAEDRRAAEWSAVGRVDDARVEARKGRHEMDRGTAGRVQATNGRGQE